jgi:hypothetical protein
MQDAVRCLERPGLGHLRAGHKRDSVARGPGQPPTHGVEAHPAEAIQLVRTFPDNRVENRPGKVFFASGDWTYSIARFTGTMTGPMALANGTELPPTGKSFEVEFCTVARWNNGQIVEENLFYALVGLTRHLGLSDSSAPE